MISTADIDPQTRIRKYLFADRRYYFSSILVLFACWHIAPATAEPFIGQFELKNLESAPGMFEFQSQNAWSWDQPPRRIQSDGAGEFEMDENAVIRERYALELEMGFSRSLKMRVGIEFEKERLDDPETIEQANDFDDLEFAEVGLELVGVLVPREGDGVGMGFVAELEGPIDQEESNNLALGSILEFQSGRWLASAVPMVVHSFGGDSEAGSRIDNKWDFAYAAQIMHTFSENWSLALEGYGTVERLGTTGHPSASAEIFGDFNQHRVGAILYHMYEFGGLKRGRPIQGSALSDTEENEGANLSIGFGLLEGMNEHTPDHTLKLSIEVDF